jgi:hypothetical protein
MRDFEIRRKIDAGIKSGIDKSVNYGRNFRKPGAGLGIGYDVDTVPGIVNYIGRRILNKGAWVPGLEFSGPANKLKPWWRAADVTDLVSFYHDIDYDRYYSKKLNPLIAKNPSDDKMIGALDADARFKIQSRLSDPEEHRDRKGDIKHANDGRYKTNPKKNYQYEDSTQAFVRGLMQAKSYINEGQKLIFGGWAGALGPNIDWVPDYEDVRSFYLSRPVARKNYATTEWDHLQIANSGYNNWSALGTNPSKQQLDEFIKQTNEKLNERDHWLAEGWKELDAKLDIHRRWKEKRPMGDWNWVHIPKSNVAPQGDIILQDDIPNKYPDVENWTEDKLYDIGSHEDIARSKGPIDKNKYIRIPYPHYGRRGVYRMSFKKAKHTFI